MIQLDKKIIRISILLLFDVAISQINAAISSQNATTTSTTTTTNLTSNNIQKNSNKSSTGDYVTYTVCGVLLGALIALLAAVIIHYRFIRKKVKIPVVVDIDMGQCIQSKKQQQQQQSKTQQAKKSLVTTGNEQTNYAFVDNNMLPKDLVANIHNPTYAGPNSNTTNVRSTIKIPTNINNNNFSKSKRSKGGGGGGGGGGDQQSDCNSIYNYIDYDYETMFNMNTNMNQKLYDFDSNDLNNNNNNNKANKKQNIYKTITLEGGSDTKQKNILNDADIYGMNDEMTTNIEKCSKLSKRNLNTNKSKHLLESNSIIEMTAL